MNEPLRREDYRGYRIEIYLDPDPVNPRKEYPQVGWMACWHQRYMLGDEQPGHEPLHYKANTLDLDTHDMELRAEQWLGGDTDIGALAGALRDAINETFDAEYLWLPLYLYDHSGLTISTAPFSCPWDSGQVGFIFVRRGLDGLDDAQLEELLKGEVEDYDRYLKGEVFGYKLYYGDQEVDSCWAMDSDLAAITEARYIVDHYYALGHGPHTETTMGDDTFPSEADQRVRNEYRVLTDEEKAQMKKLKAMGAGFIRECEIMGNTRELSIAKTKMEEAVMWAVKDLTA